MSVIVSPFMDTITRLKGLKKTQTILPIIKKNAEVSCLMVGDEVGLRSSYTSPVLYDRELISLLNEYTVIAEEEGNKKLSYIDFCSQLSNIDKISLIWALYKSTYEVLDSKRKITCPEESCKAKHEYEVILEDLIHEDTYTFWEEPESFTTYGHPLEIIWAENKFEFLSKLPTIQDNNNLISRLSVKSIQQNLEKISSIFTEAQSMALVTKAIRITLEDGTQVETDNPQEILMACQTAIPAKVSEGFFKQYGKKFDKYNPNFYLNVECKSCGNNFKHDIDLELEFFRRSLLGGE